MKKIFEAPLMRVKYFKAEISTATDPHNTSAVIAAKNELKSLGGIDTKITDFSIFD